MRPGKAKSRTFRRVKVKTPGGVTSLKYKRRKPPKARCAITNKPLPGTMRELPYKMRNMAKTKKRPERPFGGVLSSDATRKLLKNKAREISKDFEDSSLNILDVGMVCMKIAGRDSNKICVIVNRLDDNHVVIEGDVRRRKCNIKHLEPLGKMIKIGKTAKYEEVVKELNKAGFKINERKESKFKKARLEKQKTSPPKPQVNKRVEKAMQATDKKKSGKAQKKEKQAKTLTENKKAKADKKDIKSEKKEVKSKK